jgi:hypothetical protein
MEAKLYKTHNELGVIKADKDKLIKYVMMDDKLATYEEVLIAANCSETEGLLEKFQEERREKEKRAEAEKKPIAIEPYRGIGRTGDCTCAEDFTCSEHSTDIPLLNCAEAEKEGK